MGIWLSSLRPQAFSLRSKKYISAGVLGLESEDEVEVLTYLVPEHRLSFKDFLVLSSAFELGSRGPQQAMKASFSIGHLFSIGVPSNAALIASLSAF